MNNSSGQQDRPVLKLLQWRLDTLDGKGEHHQSVGFAEENVANLEARLGEAKADVEQLLRERADFVAAIDAIERAAQAE